MARIEIRELSDDLPDAAGALLADRHQAHRQREPALDARYEAPALARAEIPQLLAGGFAALAGLVRLTGES